MRKAKSGGEKSKKDGENRGYVSLCAMQCLCATWECHAVKKARKKRKKRCSRGRSPLVCRATPRSCGVPANRAFPSNENTDKTQRTTSFHVMVCLQLHKHSMTHGPDTSPTIRPLLHIAVTSFISRQTAEKTKRRREKRRNSNFPPPSPSPAQSPRPPPNPPLPKQNNRRNTFSLSLLHS